MLPKLGVKVRVRVRGLAHYYGVLGGVDVTWGKLLVGCFCVRRDVLVCVHMRVCVCGGRGGMGSSLEAKSERWLEVVIVG